MRLAELRGKRIALYGTGRESVAVLSRVLEQEPASVIALDDSASESFSAWQREHGAVAPAMLTADFDFARQPIDVLVKSPGISRYLPALQTLISHGVTVTGSTQLWLAEHAPQTIGVTGSKGKSTTSSLIHHLLSDFVEYLGYGGNIGLPLFAQGPADRWVAEFSSFQSAEALNSPDTVVLTSLFPEHLDWHLTEGNYYRDKLNLAAHSPRRVVVNALDERLVQHLAAALPGLSYEAVGAGDGVWLGEHLGERVFMLGDEPLFSTEASPLLGEHNLQNLAVALTVLAGEIDLLANRARVEARLRNFAPLPHRLTVTEAHGRFFVDDSLSTNPQAAIAALAAFNDKQVTLLLGGQNRGADYSALRERLAAHPVTALIGLPGSGSELLDYLVPAGIPSFPTSSMTQAVAAAIEHTLEGGYILLSPAAPSFGVFRDYADRAEQFLQAVAAYQAAKS